MGVSLITSRIVLETLGIEDFGIYNIVAGVVILFSFLNNAMSNATQRFLNFEIGKNDTVQLKKVFSASVNVHLILAFLILLLAETVGLWLINNKINIPFARISVANWVYQVSIITFLVSIIQVPFNATIIAHEKMSFYAYISILEVTLKFVLVYLLQFLSYDKLKIYSVLICSVSIIILITYVLYCYKKFPTSRYKHFWDKTLYKQLLSFSGWSIFGSLANVGKTQLINILLNIFCGVRVNAAMGITNQVSTAVYNFVSNFQTAFNPQIVKSYASSDKKYFNSLVFQTSKFSYYLTFILALPILINTRLVLELWLKSVPEYTIQFCQLSIITILIESISGPIWMSVNATGKIKGYQIVMSALVFLNVPISYILLKYNYLPYYILVVNVVICVFSLFTRLAFVKHLVNFPVKQYLKEVVIILMVVTILSIPLPYVTVLLVERNFLGFLITSLTSVLSVGSIIYLFGLKKQEQDLLKLKFYQFIKSKNNSY